MPSKTHFFLARFARSKRLQNAVKNAVKNAFFSRALRAQNAFKTPSKRLQNAVKNAFFSRASRAQNGSLSPASRLAGSLAGGLAAASPPVSPPSRSRSRRRRATVSLPVSPPSRRWSRHLSCGCVLLETQKALLPFRFEARFEELLWVSPANTNFFFSCQLAAADQRPPPQNGTVIVLRGMRGGAPKIRK